MAPVKLSTVTGIALKPSFWRPETISLSQESLHFMSLSFSLSSFLVDRHQLSTLQK